MTHLEALERIAHRNGIARLRHLCDDANPNGAQRDKYRDLVIKLATGQSVFPPLHQQAANLASAVVRAAGAAVHHQPVFVTRDQHAARDAACQACPSLVDGRCVECGCGYAAKILLATEDCPLDKWPKLAPPSSAV